MTTSPLLRRPRAAFDALPEHRRGLLAVLAAAVLWSTGGLFIKWVDVDALAITMWRSLLAGATLAIVLRPPMVWPWRARPLLWGLAISYALMLLLFVTATRLTTAANAIFLQYTAPFYVLILSRLFLTERATRLDLVALVAAFGGMALFFVGRLEARDTQGNICAVASGVFFAIFLILLRVPSANPINRPQSMILGNALLFFGLLPVNAFRGADAFTPSPGDAAALVFLGVVQIGLAYAVLTYGIHHVQALEMSLIGMLEPVLNPVWVFIFLGETPGWWAVAGGAVIIAAVGGRTIAVERSRIEALPPHPETTLAAAP
jgi:drug/metabolite transporter (DMT)-like permease